MRALFGIAALAFTVAACGGAASYGGYTRKEARLEARYALLHFLDVNRSSGDPPAQTLADRMTIIELTHGRAKTGADAWRA